LCVFLSVSLCVIARHACLATSVLTGQTCLMQSFPHCRHVWLLAHPEGPWCRATLPGPALGLFCEIEFGLFRHWHLIELFSGAGSDTHTNLNTKTNLQCTSKNLKTSIMDHHWQANIRLATPLIFCQRSDLACLPCLLLSCRYIIQWRAQRVIWPCCSATKKKLWHCSVIK